MLALRAVALAALSALVAVAPAGSVAIAVEPALEPGCGPASAFDALFPPPGDGAPAPVTHACWGKIQPGAAMTRPAGCTMNWVVRDATGALYIGTAGHCVAATSSVSVWGVGRIGDVAYRVCCGAGNDFALVRIDPALYDRVDPTLCHWGGPSRVGTAQQGETLLVYGFGLVYGQNAATRARVGVGWSTYEGVAQYVGMMQPGDSGAPVMSESGEAVGVHVQSSLSAVVVRVDPSFKYATRLDTALAAAGDALGTTFELVPSSTPVSLLGA